MKLKLKLGDILDEVVDILICSANPQLNLSGGVGGALLLKYGHSEQVLLHEELEKSGKRLARRGDIFLTRGANNPYKGVIHAVSVDGAYETTQEDLAGIIAKCIRLSEDLGAKTVALAALATGYGNASGIDFARALAVAHDRLDASDVKVAIVVEDPYLYDELRPFFVCEKMQNGTTLETSPESQTSHQHASRPRSMPPI